MGSSQRRRSMDGGDLRSAKVSGVLRCPSSCWDGFLQVLNRVGKGIRSPADAL
jgi:hypothetical protein